MTTNITGLTITSNEIKIDYKKDDSKSINLAPNRIFSDTYGFYSLQSPGFPPLAWNLNGCANYFYFVKMLTEHALDNTKNKGTTIPASLFQLSGGNLPIKDQSNTYPMRYNGGFTDLTLYDPHGGKANSLSGTLEPYGTNVFVTNLTTDNKFKEFSENYGTPNIPPTGGSPQFFASKNLTITTSNGDVITRPMIKVAGTGALSHNSILLIKDGGAIIQSSYKPKGGVNTNFYYSPSWAYGLTNNSSSNIKRISGLDTIIDTKSSDVYVASSWWANFNIGINKTGGNNPFNILDSNYQYSIIGSGVKNWSSSQFTTYIFGENGIGPSLENVDTSLANLKISNSSFYNQYPKSEINCKEYFSKSSYNKGHSGLKGSDFSKTENIDLWNWESSRYNILKACNITSINFGSNSAYTIAPYSLLSSGDEFGNNETLKSQSVYGASWVLYDKIKGIKNTGTSISLGGFANAGNTNLTDYWTKAAMPNISDSVATYSHLEGTAPVSEYPVVNDTKVSAIIDVANNNSNDSNVQHPYIALYLFCASGGVPAFWQSLRLFRFQLYYLGMTCMMMEDAMTSYNSSVGSKSRQRKIAGEICLSPDFGNGFAQLLPTTGGKLPWDTLFGPWDKKVTTGESFIDGAINYYADDTDKEKMYKDLLEVCQQFASKSQWKSYMTKVVTYIKGDGEKVLKEILDYSENGFRALHAMIGFIANICGPNVKVGHDIGWTFNPMGNGNWAHHKFGTGTGIGNFDHKTVTDLSNSSYTNSTDLKGFTNKYQNAKFYVDATTEMNPIAPALYYLQNVVYGSNYTTTINPPIYSGSSGGGSAGIPIQCSSGHQFLKGQQLNLVYGITFENGAAKKDSISNLVKAGVNGIALSFINPPNNIFTTINTQGSYIQTLSSNFQNSLISENKNEGIIYLSLGGQKQESNGWDTAFSTSETTTQFANDCIKACKGFISSSGQLFAQGVYSAAIAMNKGNKLYPLYENISNINSYESNQYTTSQTQSYLINLFNTTDNTIVFNSTYKENNYDLSSKGYYKFIDSFGDTMAPQITNCFYNNGTKWENAVIPSLSDKIWKPSPPPTFNKNTKLIFEISIANGDEYSYIYFNSNSLSPGSSPFKMYYGIDLDIELSVGDTTTQNNISTNFPLFLDTFRKECPKDEFPLQVDSFSNPTDPSNDSHWMYKGLFKYGPTYKSGFNYLGLMVGGAGTQYLNYWTGSLGVDKATKSEYIPYDCRVCNFYYGSSSYIGSLFPKNITQLESFFKYNNMNTAVWQWTLSDDIGGGDNTSYNQLKGYISKSKFLTDFKIDYKGLKSESQLICNVDSLCIKGYNNHSYKLTSSGKTELSKIPISGITIPDLINTSYFTQNTNNAC